LTARGGEPPVVGVMVATEDDMVRGEAGEEPVGLRGEVM
jgi:hypothetical protein